MKEIWYEDGKGIRYKHLMIDLETLGLTPGSIIRSCAVVAFDPETGKVGGSWEWRINMQQSQNAGFTIDTSTVKWWMMQSEAARKSFVEGEETRPDIFLHELAMIMRGFGENMTLWCLQLDYDIPMLRSYYSWLYKTINGQEEVAFPWNRRRVRDVRPYMDALEAANLLPPKTEYRHTPLADCMAQINMVHLALKHNLPIR